MDFLLPLQMGPTGCPQMSVTNYQPTPHNLPEEQRPEDKSATEKKRKKKTKTQKLSSKISISYVKLSCI